MGMAFWLLRSDRKEYAPSREENLYNTVAAQSQLAAGVTQCDIPATGLLT
jgi:hypothetical protein